ncbi:MAG: hypothetical protein PHE93_00430 [Clostridia bacterium]|nr:hypothetical protein [Clostridia bacterium]
MRESIDNKMTKIVTRIVVLVLIVSSIFILTACNEEFAPLETKNFYAYVIESFTEDDSASAYVRIGFTNDIETENILTGVDVVCEKLNKQTFWFSYVKYIYSADGVILRSAVMDYINATGTDELKNVDIEDLKVLYQYATIYKSTITNGSVEKQANTYVHMWEYELDENILIDIELRNEIRASWYLIIMATAVVFLMVFVPLTVVRSKKIKANKIAGDKAIENDTANLAQKEDSAKTESVENKDTNSTSETINKEED